MSFEYSPYILPLIVAMMVSGWSVFYMWSHRRMNGILMLILLAVGVVVWTFGYALEIAGIGLAAKVFWGKVQYFGIVLIPVTWVFFALTYTNQSYELKPRIVALLLVVPSITLALTLTTEVHGLVWREYDIMRGEGVHALDIVHGWWFWVYWGYAQLLVLTGTVIVVRSLLRTRGAFRGQQTLFFAAVIAPWIGNLVYIISGSSFDLTPFGFTVSVGALVWAIFGFRLMDITPLARDLVVDAMRDGMIVLDARNNVVDINSAAAQMIGVPPETAIGKRAEEVFHPWPHLVEKFARVTQARDEIRIGDGEAERRYEVRLSALQDRQGQFAGRVIMLTSMDENIPQPRFAVREPVTGLLDGEMPQGTADASAWDRHRAWSFVRDFFAPPVKLDLPVDGNVNPTWSRTIERVFTIMLRVMVVLGTVLFALVLPGGNGLAVYSLVTFATLIVLWTLALWRNSPLRLRTTTFLLVIYAMAVLEMYTYGYSLEAFTYLFSIIILAVLIEDFGGGLVVLFVSIVTMGIFGWLITQGIFVPPGLPNTDAPQGDLRDVAVTVITFGAAALALIASINVLMRSLNHAWQKEVQALNLLQQERDLLGQRVDERTVDLATARDEAEKISNNLRKYFRAIEQSGNTIVITDIRGNIEYANPRFESSTGYSVAEAMGQNPRILNSGHQPKDYYLQMWKTISDGKVWEGEFLNKRKDGSLYWEFATIAPVVDQNGVITNYVAIKEEITERKQAEDQLQKLSRAVEQSANTVLIMDRNGLIEYVNPKFSEVTGYSAEEALGKPPAALMNNIDADFDFRSQEWWQTVTAGQIWHGEFCNRRKDGALFWESAAIAPVFNRSGTIINFVEIKQDITRQKVLQDQLQKQNDYLSILHEVTLDLLNRRELGDLLQVVVERSATLLDAPLSELMIERDGCLVVEAFTAANQVDLKGDRVSRGEAKLSWQAFDTHKPAILADYSTWDHRRKMYDSMPLHAVADFPVMAGDRCLGVLALGRSQPGHPFTAEQVETGILFARLVALVLDNANLYDEAVREIAERKRTETLLQESEARFRQIVENASDIIYRTDANGCFTYANPSALKMMGYDGEEEIIGHHYLEQIMPAHRHRAKRFYDRQFLSKTKDSYYEFSVAKTDGHVAWVGQSVHLIMDDERVVGFQAVARDITQLKQVQEALALSRDQALEASRFKSQLLSRVSHELRTPLGGILGYAELLQYNAFGELNANQKNALGDIIESTQYLTSVVNDLLDEAQIESKSLSLYDEYFNPADLLEKNRSTMSVLADRKGLSFAATMDADLPGELYGDVNRLQQILVNLVGNAIKFTKSGEVSLRFKRPTPTQWSIQVQDTGAGIPLEDQQNIFEPFRQVNNLITRQNRGSGLGLAITKQLVELMDGQISLASQPGMGSLFTVVLPIKNAHGE